MKLLRDHCIYILDVRYLNIIDIRSIVIKTVILIAKYNYKHGMKLGLVFILEINYHKQIYLHGSIIAHHVENDKNAGTFRIAQFTWAGTNESNDNYDEWSLCERHSYTGPS